MDAFDYELNARLNEMETASKKRNARSAIDARMRENETHYRFDDLKDRFADALAEELADAAERQRHNSTEAVDEWLTIKIPSGCEFMVRTQDVATALGRSM